jgi:hypothetical protein
VLGFGCSHFDTFQNCPRLTDKLLADLGAIRAVSREECDDSDEDHTKQAKVKWGDAVLKVLQSGKVPSAPVGDWTDACTQNGATILDKHDDMLVAACVEINQCVGCTRQFFTKSFLGDDAAVLARSSGEEPASPRHRAGVASMAWRPTRRVSTNAS